MKEDELKVWAEQFRRFAKTKGTKSLELTERWREQNFSDQEIISILESLVNPWLSAERRKSGLNWLNLSRLKNYLSIDQRNFEFWLFCELAGLEYFAPRLHHITSIRGKGISEIPERIGRLCNLRRLYSYGGKYSVKAGNVLTQIPESIGECRQLRSIQISHHGLQELPKSIGQLRKLRKLALYKNQLKTLPEEIGNLQKLTYLDLSSNQITHLPESIGNLPSKCFISLLDNPLEVFPKTIQSIEISTEQWNCHKEEIIASKHLKYCQLHYTKEMNLEDLFLLDPAVDIGLIFSSKTIEKFPKELKGLVNLCVLTIDYCAVQIPEWFSAFQRLEELHLQLIDPIEFPKEILSCQKLRHLTVCSNFDRPLRKIPEDIGKLQLLETLNLKENSLKELPDSLWRLHNLRELDLSMNRFSEISGEILNLKKLRSLNLKYNSIDKESLKIFRLFLKRGLMY